LTPGYHQKKNLLAAGIALLDIGLPPDFVGETLGTFPGIEHRLEFFHQADLGEGRVGVRFYNDTTATIPEAAAAAVRAFGKPPILVCGGTDKNLNFSPLVEAAPLAKAVILLAGTASDKLADLFKAAGLAWEGPFDKLDEAVLRAMGIARTGDVVVMSPGCTSFGMFQNEFDRGRKWKEAVLRLSARRA
jgi:UDP-N-acetylmuramoylalanine--D-glutamate ligase